MGHLMFPLQSDICISMETTLKGVVGLEFVKMGCQALAFHQMKRKKKCYDNPEPKVMSSTKLFCPTNGQNPKIFNLHPHT